MSAEMDPLEVAFEPDETAAARPRLVRPAGLAAVGPGGEPARPGAAALRGAPRPGRGPIYRGMPRPVSLGLWSAFAIGVGAATGLTAPAALHRIGLLVAIQPAILPWYGVRALGFLAWLAVAGSVVYGLLLSTKLLDAVAHRPISLAVHKDLAIAGLVLSALHGGLLLADHSFTFTARSLLVPFASPYAPLWVGIGQIALYAFAVVTASFYVRRQIGQRAWRLIHYLTFLAFAAAAIHGIASGTDSRERWAFWLYLVPIAIAVFLTVYRAVTGTSAALRRHYAAPAIPAATLPATLGASRLPLVAPLGAGPRALPTAAARGAPPAPDRPRLLPPPERRLPPRSLVD